MSPCFFLVVCFIFKLWHHMKLTIVFTGEQRYCALTLADKQRDPNGFYIPRPFECAQKSMRCVAKLPNLLKAMLNIPPRFLRRAKRGSLSLLVVGGCLMENSFFCRALIHIRFCPEFCMPKKTLKTLLLGCGSGCGLLLAH